MQERLRKLYSFLISGGYSDQANQLVKTAAPLDMFYPESKDLSNWQDWMSNLVTPIVIFSFDSSELKASDINKMRKVFGHSDDEVEFEEGEYDVAVQPSSMFSNSKKVATANISDFISAFPEFGAKLKLKSLDINDIVLMLYNKKPIQMGSVTFDRSPQYFVHDIFHFFEEFNQDFVAKFILSISDFLKFALSCYEDESGKSPEQNLFKKSYWKFFTGFYSLETDANADLFSIAAKGDFKKSFMIPDELSFNDKIYKLDPENKSEIINRFESLNGSINKMLKNSDNDPLKDYKGKVLLHDFVP